MKNEKGSIGVGLAVVGAIVGVVVVLPLIGIALGIIQLPFLKLQKKVELNAGVISKTYETEYCISNYEWFKDTFQDIQQADVQVDNTQKQVDAFTTAAPDRSKWTFEDKQQYNRLTNQLTGIQNFKADLVGQYNSRSQQLNRVACKELPLFVNP